MEQCKEFMRQCPKGAMVCIEQHAHDQVYVPPAWIHSVFTVRTCVKMAYDYMIVDNFPSYMAAWAHVGTALAKESGQPASVWTACLRLDSLPQPNATDYMDVSDVAINFVMSPPSS